MGVLSITRGSLGTNTSAVGVSIRFLERRGGLAMEMSSGNYNVANRRVGRIASPFCAAHAAHGMNLKIPLFGVTTRVDNNSFRVSSIMGRNASLATVFGASGISFIPLNSVTSAIRLLYISGPSIGVTFARDSRGSAFSFRSRGVQSVLNSIPVSTPRIEG